MSKEMHLAPELRRPFFSYLLNLADDALVLGQRLAAWCGHGPILEEDIALTNISLDLFGQATLLLDLAAVVEGEGRTADDLAFFRDETEFRNHLLTEQLNGDFALTIARQFFFDCYRYLLEQALCASSFRPLAAIAQKSLKETTYHLRHSASWVVQLGDGTEESHERMQSAIDALWTYTGELLSDAPDDIPLIAADIVCSKATLQARWQAMVHDKIVEATLKIPSVNHMQSGGRLGQHTEFLGHMLSEMQILPRSYPDATW